MSGTRRQRRKKIALLLVAALAGGIGVAAYATHLLRRSELQTIDARYSIRGARKPPSNIVFVAISLAAEQELEEHHLDARSPLPRKYDAEVIDHLRLAGAKAIAMDMEFTHPTNERRRRRSDRSRRSRARESRPGGDDDRRKRRNADLRRRTEAAARNRRRGRRTCA